MAIYLRSLAAFVVLLGLSAAAAAESMTESLALESVASPIQDILHLFGFPKGLLPKSAESLSVNNNNGEFEVELPAPCGVNFPPHFYYEPRIKGKLSLRLISDLSGIYIRSVGHLNITTIVAHPDDSTVAFQIGSLWEYLPVALFDEIRGCEPKVGCRGSAARL